jgi:serine/threonine-protein kinase
MDADSHVGRQIGAYRITRFCWYGTPHDIYDAVHEPTGAPVVVAALGQPWWLKDDSSRTAYFAAQRAHLERVRRAHERIAHPHVGPWAREVVDGDERFDHYVVFDPEFGENLETILEKAPLSLARAGEVLLPAIDAVDAAHAAGVVHGALDSRDVLVLEGGTVKVLGFGALSEEGLAGKTAAVGTASYAAPERILGRPAAPASDIYSLGVILCEAVTGRLPFRRDDERGLLRKIVKVATGRQRVRDEDDLLRKILKEPPSLPRGGRADFPEALERIILRALEKDPARRFARAGDLAAELRAVCPPGIEERNGRQNG